MSAATIDKPPTERQKQILDFVWRYWRENGFPPTIRRVMEEFGFTTTNGVLCHFQALRKKGWLRQPEKYATRGWVPIARDGLCPCCRRPMPEGGA